MSLLSEEEFGYEEHISNLMSQPIVDFKTYIYMCIEDFTLVTPLMEKGADLLRKTHQCEIKSSTRISSRFIRKSNERTFSPQMNIQGFATNKRQTKSANK